MWDKNKCARRFEKVQFLHISISVKTEKVGNFRENENSRTFFCEILYFRENGRRHFSFQPWYEPWKLPKI